MRPLPETRRVLLERGATKHGDRPFVEPTLWLVRELRAELADVAGWAWVLHVRAGGYPEELRPVVRHETEWQRDMARRCNGLVRAVWQTPGVATAAPVVPRGLVRPPFGLPATRSPTRRDAVFACRVGRRLEAGRLKYGDRSYYRPGRDLVAELGEEVASAQLWAEFLWTRLVTAGVAGGHLEDTCASLTDALRHMYHRLASLQLMVDTAEAQAETQIVVQPLVDARSWAEEVRHGR